MDEPIDPPEPHADLPAPAVEAVDSLDAPRLRHLVEYARERLDYLQAPVSEFIEPGEDEEILRVEDRDVYTIVVKRRRCEDECADCPHEPRAYVVTMEPDTEEGRHLHWVDIGRMHEAEPGDPN